MRADATDGHIHVRLSRRNLLALLTKLDHNWSARELTSREVYADGERRHDATVHVVAEPDEQHYHGRLPGTMHPQTEADIRVAS